MLRLVAVLGFVLCILAISLPLALSQSPSSSGLSADQRQVAQLKSTRHDITVSAMFDKADATYRIGEALGLSVTASEEVFLTILNVGSSGRVTVLVPNAHQKLARVPARQAISIPARDAPYAIRVGGPSGFELIKVIATKEPVDLLADEASRPAGTFRSLEAPARTIARSLESDLERKLKHGYVAVELVLRVLESEASKR